MYTILLMASFCLVLLLNSYCLAILKRKNLDWPQRRKLQMLVLLSPIMPLGFASLKIWHFAFFHTVCFLNIWIVDEITLAASFAMGLSALGAIIVGGIRLILLRNLARHQPWYEYHPLQTLTQRLASYERNRQVRVLLDPDDQPQAHTHGIVHPVIVVSKWMLMHMDQQELEAVICHELAHINARDMLLIWIGTMLRDAFFYLPMSHIAYRQFVHEKELACDDRAITMTGRPMALASALLKVSFYVMKQPPIGHLGAQLLISTPEAMSMRIERLLHAHDKQHHVANTFSIRSIARGHVSPLLVLKLVALAMVICCLGSILAIAICHLMGSLAPLLLF